MRDPQTCDMITACGHYVWFDAPELTAVDTQDIRRATINACRYAGHLNWRLVQHSDLVVQLAQLHFPDNALAPPYAGCHDFHEIITGDMVSGMKRHVPNYNTIEHQFELHFHTELGLPWKYRPHKEVHHVDMRALVCEMTALRHPGAELVAKKYGGPPTEEEMALMNDVRARTRSESWDEVWNTIVNGQARVALLIEMDNMNGERKD